MSPPDNHIKYSFEKCSVTGRLVIKNQQVIRFQDGRKIFEYQKGKNKISNCKQIILLLIFYTIIAYFCLYFMLKYLTLCAQ